jgi:hypothetical protein
MAMFADKALTASEGTASSSALLAVRLISSFAASAEIEPMSLFWLGLAG